MELTLVWPRQRTTVPILIVAILLGLLLSPVLERALESWMPTAVTGGQQQNKGKGNSGRGSSHDWSWDLRSTWNQARLF